MPPGARAQFLFHGSALWTFLHLPYPHFSLTFNLFESMYIGCSVGRSVWSNIFSILMIFLRYWNLDYGKGNPSTLYIVIANLTSRSVVISQKV